MASTQKLSKPKATWSYNLHKSFIDLCLEQVVQTEKKGTSFSKEGWNKICEEFNKRNGKQYDKKQIKNHWDNTKADWKIWWKLKEFETGLGWILEKNTVKADDAWWDDYIKKCPDASKFRFEGIEHADKLTSLFLEGMATGESAWAPSQGSLPDDSTRACQNNENESFVDVDLDPQNTENILELNDDTSTSERVTHTRRQKRKVDSIPPPEPRRRVSTMIREIGRIGDICEEMINRRPKHIKPPVTIEDCTNILDQIKKEVPEDSDTYMFACQLFLKPEQREMFKALKTPLLRLRWIQREAKGSKQEITLLYKNLMDVVEYSDTDEEYEEEFIVISLVAVACHNERNRKLQEDFQHSGETISRHFNNVLRAMTTFSMSMIVPPLFDQPPGYIRKNPRFWPHFKGCVGAIDGTHIDAIIPLDKQLAYRGRKGKCTQNVMAACSFDMKFTFVWAGWEGSAHDSRILREALNHPTLNFPNPPNGKYYLVDAGYPNMRGFLSPFKKVRYHNSAYQNNVQANGKEELFNRRHSSLRNVIERCFGVWKARWPILRCMAPYPFATQRLIVVASMAIHNFIRQEAEFDSEFRRCNELGENHIQDEGHESDDDSSSDDEENEMDTIRLAIANSIQAS